MRYLNTNKRRRRTLQRIENFVGNAAWHDFVSWCRNKNLQAVPANAWTLAAYIRSLEGVESLANIRKRITDIGKAHAEKSKKRPERHPMIEKTLEIIELRAEKSESQSRLFDDDDFTSEPPPKIKKTRPNSDDPAKKSARTRVMRSTPKLVSKRRLK